MNPKNEGGMNDRVKRLHRQSFDTPTTLTIERALIETAFYKENYGKMPNCILRAKNFYEICKKKTIYIGKDELIVVTNLDTNRHYLAAQGNNWEEIEL